MPPHCIMEDGIEELEKHAETVHQLLPNPTDTPSTLVKENVIAKAAVDLIADGYKPPIGIAKRARAIIQGIRFKAQYRT